tara:strand:+ start:250 stop:1125 length:876 start_codon:yes stop_codon:yes gene_type:complete
MKKIILLCSILFINCNRLGLEKSIDQNIYLDQDFKNYWFDGTAEISSYELNQYRYGQNRKGSSVLIYVTEDFLPNKQVKADKESSSTLNILKLNRTKNFLTGIYPYSIMTSIFTRLEKKKPLVKITSSIQEWCGQSFTQLNRRGGLKISSHSYFEGEADQNINLKDNLTEDEIWTLIRTQPELLPKGKILILPSIEYLQLNHKKIKFYEAEASIVEKEGIITYSIIYSKLQRKNSISFKNVKPFQIIEWTEYDLRFPEHLTKAKIIKTVKLPYWKLNNLGEESYRDSLGIK